MNTQEQRQPHFLLYNASAGSGKTTKLVTEYLTRLFLSEDPKAFKRILAITFTNKAAQEMKQRILDYLSALKENALEEHPYLEEMLESTGWKQRNYQQKASHLLSAILHQYSDFSVSTIDAFMHKLIRAFSRDLDLPTNFEVSMETEKMLEETVRQLLLEAGEENKSLTDQLVSFALDQLNEGKSWNIDYHLFSFSKILLDPYHTEKIEGLQKLSQEDWKKITQSVYRYTRKVEGEAASIAEEFFSLLEQRGIEVESFRYKKSGMPSFFYKLKSGDLEPPGARAQQFVSDQKMTGNRTPATQKAAIEESYSEICGLIEKGTVFLEEHLSTYYLYKTLQRSIYQLSLLAQLKNKLSTLKKEENTVLISDFNRLIANAIAKEYAPFIYERLGERYDYIFIDEFQDTSTLQFQNFLPLIENAIAKNYQTLLVGDVKQSIYRWRGGEADLLGNFPAPPAIIEDKEIRQRFLQFKEFKIKHQPLRVNRRSKKQLIQFNNLFFAQLLDTLPEDIQHSFSDFEQEIPKNKEGGFVEVQVLPDEKKEEILPIQLAALHKTVVSLLNRTQEVEGKKEKVFFPKDLAILARRKEEESEIASFLSEQGIPVISAEGLLVFQAPEVKVILAALRDFYEGSLGAEKRASFWVWLQKASVGSVGDFDPNANSRLLEEVLPQFNPSTFAERSLYEKAAYLADAFGFLKSQNPFVLSFLNHLFEQTHSKQLGYAELWDWVQDQKEKLAIQTPEGANAVSIMTIHKAKGLQFPVVLVPFMWWEIRVKEFKQWLSFKKPIEKLQEAYLPISSNGSKKMGVEPLYEDEKTKVVLDNLNLLYVALTRAKEELYLFTKEEPKKKSETPRIEKWMANLIEANPFPFSQKENSYCVGSRLKERRVSKTPMEEKVQPFEQGNWINRVKISERFQEREKRSTPLFKGLLWHDVMAEVATNAQVNEVLRQKEKEGILTQEKATHLSEICHRFMNHKLIAPAFQKEASIYNERALLLPNGNTLRPDRVAKHKDQWYIIDYKTGEPTEEHAKQVKEYGLLLAQKEKNVKGFVVYLTDGAVHQVF